MNVYHVRVFSVTSLTVLCLGTLEFLQKTLCFENVSGHKDVAAAQDVLKGKQASFRACTVSLFHRHKNLLLEILTSVMVVIMCQRVWREQGGLLSSWLNKN